MSSAAANASGNGVRRSIVASSRSLGIVITVSTHSRSSTRPRSAWVARRLPSNLNGLVTTALVSAPSSVARLAITGAVAAGFRILPGAGALGQLAADLDLGGRRALLQGLEVRVGDHEFDAAESR